MSAENGWLEREKRLRKESLKVALVYIGAAILAVLFTMWQITTTSGKVWYG